VAHQRRRGEVQRAGDQYLTQPKSARLVDQFEGTREDGWADDGVEKLLG